jgi:hypothetical protein
VLRFSQPKSMSENPTKQKTSGKKNSETAKIIAGIAHVTPAYVRMVMNGERENDSILNATVLYEQEKSELIKKIEQLVPFH